MTVPAQTPSQPQNQPQTAIAAVAPQTQPTAPVTAPADGGTNGSGQPQQQPQQTQAGIDLDTHTAMVEKARADEKAKLYSSLEKAKADAKKQAETVAGLQKQIEELKTLTDKDLSADQRLAKQIESLKADIVAERTAREASEKQAASEIQRSNLEAYKHRRLAEVGGELIAELVGGNSQEEIEASIMVAHAEYQRLRQRFEQEFQATHGTMPNTVPTTVATVVEGAQSPHFTPPATGFPSPVSPVPVAQTQVDLGSLANLTSEQAVRSGEYEKVRGQLLDNLKSVSPSGGNQVLGGIPRHMAQPAASTPHVSMSGGVMQPQGYPTGPVQPAGMYAGATLQQPAPVSPGTHGIPQPVAGQVTDPRAMAMAAVNRTNAGNNPLVQQQAHLAPPGVQPQGDASAAVAAHQARFTPTPPITQ